MTTLRKTLTLPDALARALDEAALQAGMSLNSLLVERLRSAETMAQALAKARADLAECRQHSARLGAERATLPPPGSQDLMPSPTPETIRLRDECDAALASAAKANKALALANGERRRFEQWAEHWRDHAKAQGEALKAQLAQCQAALVAERARRRPWYLHIPIPLLRLVEVGPLFDRYTGERAMRWWHMGPSHAFLVFLLLWGLVWMPWDSAAMRWVATTAMGTYGDAPKAAARLHGGPILGAADLVQFYSLVRTADNGRRIDRCFARAGRLHAKGRKAPVACTILIPHDIAAHCDFISAGPHADSLGWWGWVTPWRAPPSAKAAACRKAFR
jgi:hypothetical protein